MNKIKYFLHKIQDVKLKDILSIFPMFIGLILSFVQRKKLRNSWLVCEEKYEARDNGFSFFKYVNENHPSQDIYFAISDKSPDYKKVKNVGKTISYGGIDHWKHYFSCKFNISSQKGGKPNAALCAVFELNNIFKNKNIFLQHGITINEPDWLKSDRSKFIKFYTSTTDEYDFIKENFGYSEGVVELTGLSRFDGLHNVNVVKNRVLIMPTWRSWFRQKTTREDESDADFENSQYLLEWNKFINSTKLNALIDKYKLEVIFFPHRNLQEYIKLFGSDKTKVKIASFMNYDVQDLLKTSEMIVTDYSSVFFDMVYMKKPVIFYQFDEEKFRRQQYGKGYFDYFNNKFGNAYKNSNEVIDNLECIIKKNFGVDSEYLKEHNRIFKYYDQKNSERIYNSIMNIK